MHPGCLLSVLLAIPSSCWPRRFFSRPTFVSSLSGELVQHVWWHAEAMAGLEHRQVERRGQQLVRDRVFRHLSPRSRRTEYLRAHETGETTCWRSLPFVVNQSTRYYGCSRTVPIATFPRDLDGSPDISRSRGKDLDGNRTPNEGASGGDGGGTGVGTWMHHNAVHPCPLPKEIPLPYHEQAHLHARTK